MWVPAALLQIQLPADESVQVNDCSIQAPATHLGNLESFWDLGFNLAQPWLLPASLSRNAPAEFKTLDMKLSLDSLGVTA